MLDSQIPVLDARWNPIVLVGDRQAEGKGEGHVRRGKLGSILRRERIGRPLVRVHEGDIEKTELRTEGRTIHHIVESLDKRWLIEQAPSTANRCLALSARIVSETDARTEVLPA